VDVDNSTPEEDGERRPNPMETTMMDYTQAAEDYRRIEQAIKFLEANYQRQPELQEVAASIHLSEYHFQRLFTRWVGISPKRFLQYLTKEHAKELLASSGNVLEAAYQSGLSGPGRLHDLFVSTEAVTPGEYKNQGAGLDITYGYHSTPFGECLLALTGRGICNLIFVQDDNRNLALAELRKSWRRAGLYEEPRQTASIARQVVEAFMGNGSLPLALHMRGTNFQIKVWEALLRIPAGSVVAYEDIAEYLGMPGAARAVGSAVARNPLPLLIPCHRVIHKGGDFSGYRYGTARKMAILGWEMVRAAEYAQQNSVEVGVR
jgi:AraC family transcriptional regulator, regulatory protein of adaptative response / methylated-DNA-[protein]-cysteine methyltransferase